MEQIYFAVSPQFQGLVKIGRTDRDISERMGELAGYGLEGFDGVSSWSPSKKHVLVVDDNTASEALLTVLSIFLSPNQWRRPWQE